MSPRSPCNKLECPNNGKLVLDANSVFYIAEGAIKSVEAQHPDLTNANRLPYILDELDYLLNTIRSCCSRDGNLHISDCVMSEVSLDDKREIDRKGLAELGKFSNSQRRNMFQILCHYFPIPVVVSEQEIQAVRRLFNNPRIRPNNRDASLLRVTLGLAINGEVAIVVTSDPDFIKPIRWLIKQGKVSLGEGHPVPTDKILNTNYFHFLLRLHDCCVLSSDKYKPLAEAYFNAQVQRLPGLRRNNVSKRVSEELQIMWKIHTTSVQYKVTRI